MTLSRFLLRSGVGAPGSGAIRSVICLVLLHFSLQGQTPGWQINGSNVYVPAGTAVGIGTAYPMGKLQVSNAGDVRVALVPENGANNRESLLDFWATFDNYSIDVGVRRAGRIQVGFDGGVWGTEYMAFGVAGAGDTAIPPLERMRINGNGNVGIGTSNPQSKLAVNGTITTKEVVVTNTGWSDYVFMPGYHLQPLSEVSAYVQEHRHLPGIPSAREVQEKSVNVGEMEAKLLAKIEELTLHMIEANERNIRLEKETQQLRDEIQQMKRSIAR